MANPIRTKTLRHKKHQHPSARKTSTGQNNQSTSAHPNFTSTNPAAIARSLFLAGAISSQARLVYHEQTNKRNEIVQRCFVCLMRAASLFCLIAWPGVGGQNLSLRALAYVSAREF